MKKMIGLLLLVLVLALAGCTTQAGVDQGMAILAYVTPVAPLDNSQELAEMEHDLYEGEQEQVPCDIKGNVGRSGNIYHVPGGAYYDMVIVDTSEGDRWFCNEEQAQAAGFRPSQR